MKKIRKLFFDVNMSWKSVIIYSVVSAVIVALLNCIPFLKNTSFVMPAVTFEAWFVLALIVICNCKSNMEAAYKTFFYFLISQPLIYLVEVPFNSLGFGLFRYYPYWGVFTLFTLPGGFIAYYVKKDNVLGSIILSVATVCLGLFGVDYLFQTISLFPRYLVATLFCLGSSILLIFVILKSKKSRIISLSITLSCILFLIMFKLFGSNNICSSSGLEDGKWEIISSDIEASIYDNKLNICGSDGNYNVVIENEDNIKQNINIIIKDRSVVFYEE